MSLALLQGYSSAEDDREEEQEEIDSSPFALSDNDAGTSDEDDEPGFLTARRGNKKKTYQYTEPSCAAAANHSLPSALDAFSEITGPPEFLKNSMYTDGRREKVDEDRRWNKRSKEKKDCPPGTVVEAKPQLAIIRDRVRSDIEGSAPASGFTNAHVEEGKRTFTAANPEPKDAADLLSLCVQCGIPKTYSHNRGLVCPQCGDRPPPDPTKESSEKKKGSSIKDKEKSKRMKGQSSHSAWKSETEMQLRQQYD